MKNFVLMSGSTTKEVVSRFAYMKADWKELTTQQQYTCIMRMVSTLSLSQQKKDEILMMAKGERDAVDLPAAQLAMVDVDNLVEVQLIYIEIKPAIMVDATDEEYSHFLDDATDEMNK